MTKKTLFGFFALLVTITMYSCSDMNFYLPPGPQGDDGASTYEIWKEQAEQGKVPGWSKDKTTLADFLIYIKGEKGDKGADGLSAYELWKKYISKGDVANPRDPSTTWKAEENSEADFWRFLTGRDGSTPSVGQNNNWWIDGKDTGVLARGANGKDALSSYEIWKKEVEADRITWEKDKVELTDYFRYLTGKDGVDGVSPHIGPGPQYHWFIGTTDTGVPAKGNNGKSAYELWKEELKNTDLKNPITGESWPKAQDTMADFWRFMQGPKGDKGESAYAIWKALVLKQEVLVPGSDTEKWPTTKIQESDFWKFLTGKDGKDGLSAYELWKIELKARHAAGDPLVDYRTGEVWDVNLDSYQDFLNFLRGKDGKDGADGAPGEPGQPGQTIVIQTGVPNVIALYSLQDRSEFVSTVDGSVTFKVYDKNGQPAAGAKVKGLPGMAPEKEYVSESDGTFKVLKEDLPEKQDVKERMGQVQSVTIQGESTVASAPNTYVPNRIRTRLIVANPNGAVTTQKPYLTNKHVLFFKMQRKVNPRDPWTDMPNYLPNVANVTFAAYQIPTRDPKAAIGVELGTGKRATNIFTLEVSRFVKSNEADYLNGLTTAWDNNQNYFTVKEKGTTYFYGEQAVWNGVCDMAPYQATPFVKCIKLKGKGQTLVHNEVFFNKAEGELDYSRVDFELLYKRDLVYSKNGEIEYITPVKLPSEEAKDMLPNFVFFFLKSKEGDQRALSDNSPSGSKKTHYTTETVYLNSEIRVMTIYNSNLVDKQLTYLFPREIYFGKIVSDGGTGYKVQKAKTTLPEIPVSYSDN